MQCQYQKSKKISQSSTGIDDISGDLDKYEPFIKIIDKEVKSLTTSYKDLCDCNRNHSFPYSKLSKELRGECFAKCEFVSAKQQNESARKNKDS